MSWTLPVSNIELPPAGPRVARCIRVIDMGTTKNVKFNNLNRKVMITHELPTTKMESDGRPFAISGFYNQVMSKNSKLRLMLSSWLGEFTDDEAKIFNPLSVLGKPSFINIVHDEGYANIASIMPLPDDLACPDKINDIYSFSFHDFKQEEFNKLSDKMQERLKQSIEGKLKFNDNTFDRESKPTDAVNDKGNQNLVSFQDTPFNSVQKLDDAKRSKIQASLGIFTSKENLTDTECLKILEAEIKGG